MLPAVHADGNAGEDRQLARRVEQLERRLDAAAAAEADVELYEDVEDRSVAHDTVQRRIHRVFD
jgi:hypothetical protein